MMNQGYQQASSAYKSAAMQGADSHTVMLKSLQYIVRKLDEAKKLRSEDNFEAVFHCHEKIYRVLGVLENGLPSGDVDEATMKASQFLAGFYQNVRNNMRGLSARAEWEETYTQLAEAVRGLHSHLFKSSDVASGGEEPVEGINVVN